MDRVLNFFRKREIPTVMPITKKSQIPNASFYVICTDEYDTYLGPKGISILIMLCDSREEATSVEKYAQSRRDNLHTIITSYKPILNLKKYPYNYGDRIFCPHWYPKGESDEQPACIEC